MNLPELRDKSARRKSMRGGRDALAIVRGKWAEMDEFPS